MVPTKDIRFLGPAKNMRFQEGKVPSKKRGVKNVHYSVINRRWVARKFTVRRTHTRTSKIVSHALAHRTSIFYDRTRTRTFLQTNQTQNLLWWSFKVLTVFNFYLRNFLLVPLMNHCQLVPLMNHCWLVPLMNPFMNRSF